MRDDSPFTPRYPVPYDLFVGREDIIKGALRHFRQAASGRQEHVFLLGERGIGKTSLALYLSEVAHKEANLLPVCVNLAGVKTLEELVRKVFEEIANATNRRDWLATIQTLFGEHISQVGLFGISVGFNPPKDKLTHLVQRFPEALSNITAKIGDKARGLCIVLDDINGLCKTDEFANWYKGLVENISAHHRDLALAVLCAGLPEIRTALIEHQPSLMRVFSIESVCPLSDEEVQNFFARAFEKAGLQVQPSGMKVLVSHSGGLPVFMQEIGDAVFWALWERATITESDAYRGVLRAADIIGHKYLEPRVYDAIRSERYRSILRKLGKTPHIIFRKKDLEAELNGEERKVLNNFVRKMRELGVISQDKEHGAGAYKIVSPLYAAYIWLERHRFEEKARVKKPGDSKR